MLQYYGHCYGFSKAYVFSTQFIGSGSLYTGNGGAIAVTGDIVVSYCYFYNYAIEGEGGAVFVGGQGACTGTSCCFHNCYTTWYKDEKGGNAFTIYDHAVRGTLFAISKCGPDNTHRGDSSYFLYTCDFRLADNNISDSFGFSGASGGDHRFAYTENKHISHHHVSRCSEYCLIVIWGGELIVERSNFVNSVQTGYSLYAHEGMQSTMYLSHCYFSGLSAKTPLPPGDRYYLELCTGEFHSLVSEPGELSVFSVIDAARCPSYLTANVRIGPRFILHLATWALTSLNDI